MPTKIVDTLQTNLVLVGISLINTPEEIAAFRQQVDTEVMTAEAGLGTELINRSHTLNRDRIAVLRIADRTTISREYPDYAGLERLATVAATAIGVTNQPGDELRAFGYNIELIYEPDPPEPAIQYLVQRLFKQNVLHDEEARLFGGAARLYYEKSHLRWQATLEPRLNDDEATRIFASLNLHYPGSDLNTPAERDILDSLKLVWDEAHDLIERLDKAA